MATSTTTIRVPVPTRDKLAAQARQRGLSIAAFLEELSDQAERQNAFEAERTATLTDAETLEVQDEDRDWDATAGDGID
ncbi:antitoxin [Candidatus Mycobacterium methanotrophicum]|uniref:Antitoxin n=1 Tax=Candidatus Mycobacterium methanotrophicum TaxID=2943498 RepID=A0ABY4QS18_9MYCO|nr:antitoxin [Candidatus Mycobacterium methanotrophicum]UQX13474.1 antitoxin [Candidatus Mycobacterium methanotrophicum]